MKLSVVLFTFWPGEETYIEACLQTIRPLADEIIVIDNGATPQTLKVIKKYTDKVYASSAADFAARHNLGTQKAIGDWILYIDGDERVSQKLALEIKTTLANPKASAYQLRRVNFFLGKEVRFGDRYPDFVTRLFKKSDLSGWEGEIHESSKVKGEIGVLKAPLYHLTHRDVYSMMEKTINFSEAEAKLRLAAGHPPIVGWRLLRVLFSELWTRLIRYQGVRGGTEGWIDGIFQAFSLFIVYVRLWEFQRQPPLSKTYQEIDKKIVSGEL
ncbi:glycosyltransferase family 2 protein [Candidatus Microgenomates bacterium]|nr:glycosyltransferase family 2 protein [Candidatus Microgenomates bacterium]